MEKRSESFGRALKAATAAIASLEGKSQQAVEAELGGLLGVAGTTMQRYKAGYFPPDPARVEQLAEAGVRRGLLGRPWLERFLEAARLPAYSARALAGRLFPEAAPRPAVARPNLPPPTYSSFVMRPGAYDLLLAGLHSHLPATLVVSLGGMGKTSLARAAAGDCTEGRGGAPPFAAAVWVSDKDRPGTTNLSVTLDAIARVLDYPGLVALPFAERLHEVEQLLRRQAVLLVVDNADTISDDALLEWLARLPGPSRALVTSRFAIPALAGAYLVELGPMSDDEARALIAGWLPRSRLRDLPGALGQLAPLARAAGGNPKAIELALGLIQHRPRDQVIADLAEARGDLFDDLFARAWDLLDGPARRLLLALPLFPASAPAEALAYCADLSAAALQRGADQLAALALLDVERADLRGAPRYNAHALVRAYARARLAEQPPHEQERLRERWLAWCADFARAIGFCWDDLDRLDALDGEHETIQAAVAWAADTGRDQALITLVEGLRYYYNVRGLWGEETLRNHRRRAAAARRLGDQDHEALALAHHAEVLSKQGQVAEAAPLIEALIELGEPRYGPRIALRGTAADLGADPARYDDAAFEYGHARGLYSLALRDPAAAEGHWRRLLPLARELGGQKHVVARRWLATALLQQGRQADARRLYAESLDDARRIGDLRSATGNSLKLALIAIERDRLAGVAATLAECLALAERYSDRRRLAECHRIGARLSAMSGDPAAARAELQAALDLFTRLGMARAAAEARTALDQLAGGESQEAGGA